MLILSCLPEGVGDGNIVYVVHLLDSEVNQVCVGFGQGSGGFCQGWPLALGLVGAWRSRGSLEIPRGREEIPADESPGEQQTYRSGRDLTLRGQTPSHHLCSVPMRWCGLTRL